MKTNNTGKRLRLAVVGSRNFNDYSVLDKNKLKKKTRI